MKIDFLDRVFAEAESKDAIIWRDQSYSYRWLRDAITAADERLAAASVTAGSVVMIEGDFSPRAVATLLAAIKRDCIVAPFSNTGEERRGFFTEMAEIEQVVTVSMDDRISVEKTGRTAAHAHYAELRRRGHPGIVLFSSGSSGTPKGSVNDLVPWLKKFDVRRQVLRTISFLLFDHIGGFNTLLYCLSNGGCVITVDERSPDAVLGAVERHRVELLPTSPTFINLILLSEAHQRHDLSSLKLVTYGTEPMPERTLLRFHEVLPQVQLLQTYGLSEVGILRSKSRSSDSLWVRVGGEGYETRVVDGMFQIRSASAMLGYLNAPSPFTEDGWFMTGDRVDVDGEYVRFLGRASEQINVGGEKVYPAEVENVILELETVAEVTVYGEKHAIVGEVVIACVRPLSPETDSKALVAAVKKHCAARLARYKVPVKVEITNEALYTGRFKKRRG